jgi:Tfp pilus assembly protein PilF
MALTPIGLDFFEDPQRVFFLRSTDLAKIRTDLDEVIRLDPMSFGAHLYRGYLFAILKKPRSAIIHFEKAYQVLDHETPLWGGEFLRLGQWSSEKEDWSNAICYLTEAIEKERSTVQQAYLARAEAYLQIGKTEEHTRDLKMEEKIRLSKEMK